MDLRIPKDKKKHMVVGFLMGALLPVGGYYLFPELLAINLLISLGIIIHVGFGFEIFSLITGWGHAEINDAVATVMGGIAGLLCFVIGYFILI